MPTFRRTNTPGSIFIDGAALTAVVPGDPFPIATAQPQENP